MSGNQLRLAQPDDRYSRGSSVFGNMVSLRIASRFHIQL